MSERDELLDWMTTWQAEVPLSDRLRETVQRRVARSQRRWLLEAILETVVTVVGLAVTTTTAWFAATTVEWLAMVSLSIVIVCACWISPALSPRSVAAGGLVYAGLAGLPRSRAHLRLRMTAAVRCCWLWRWRSSSLDLGSGDGRMAVDLWLRVAGSDDHGVHYWTHPSGARRGARSLSSRHFSASSELTLASTAAGSNRQHGRRRPDT